jgi:hypothetical protein
METMKQRSSCQKGKQRKEETIGRSFQSVSITNGSESIDGVSLRLFTFSVSHFFLAAHIPVTSFLFQFKFVDLKKIIIMK